MAFTPVIITGVFENPDGTPSSGTLCATPSVPLSNGAIEQSDSPICGLLDDTGSLIAQSGGPFTLNATNDAGTLPQGEFYIFTLKLDGQPIVEFNSPLLTDVGDTVTFISLQESAV